MLNQDRGLLFRSNPETFADGSSVVVDTNFLKKALKQMAAPVVRQLILHIRASGTGTTGGFLGEDAYKLFKRVRIKDASGEVYSLPGSIGRVVEQMESGDKQVDNATLASGATDSTYDVYHKIHFDTSMSHRGADTAMPLLHLTNGGEIEVEFQAAPGFTVADATLRVYALVHDERSRELKSRMTWKEVSITDEEDDYQVKGSLRAAFVCSDITTAGYTSLADSVIGQVESVALDMSNLAVGLLRQEYLAKSKTRASDDEFLADTPNALPLVTPSAGQHIGKMQDLDSFDVDLSATPTSAKMVICAIRDRNASLGADWMGYGNVADFMDAVKKRGYVNTKGKGRQSVQTFNSRIARRLPVRIGQAG